MGIDKRATSNNMKLVHWPLMDGMLHFAQQGGDWAGPHPPMPLLAVPDVTAYPLTVCIPITVLLYNGPLMLCGFNVPIEWLIRESIVRLRGHCF